jgi:DNA-binding XRE family transcriptional regulator
MATFEGNIKDIRLKLGLTQEELAYRIGVSRFSDGKATAGDRADWH